LANIKYGYEEIEGTKIFVVDYTTFFDAHKMDQIDEVQYVINRIKEEIISGRSALLVRGFEDSDKKITKAQYTDLKEVEAFEKKLDELKKQYHS
jgi:hypothetical protein